MNSFFFFFYFLHSLDYPHLHTLYICVSSLYTFLKIVPIPCLYCISVPLFFFRPFVVGVIGSIERKPNKSLILRENE